MYESDTPQQQNHCWKRKFWGREATERTSVWEGFPNSRQGKFAFGSSEISFPGAYLFCPDYNLREFDILYFGLLEIVICRENCYGVKQLSRGRVSEGLPPRPGRIWHHFSKTSFLTHICAVIMLECDMLHHE